MVGGRSTHARHGRPRWRWRRWCHRRAGETSTISPPTMLMPARIAQRRRRLPCVQPPDRRAGAGCSRGIKAINVEGDIGGWSPTMSRAMATAWAVLFMHGARVDILHAEIVIALRADADLHRGCGIDHSGFHGLVEEGAVVDAGHIVIGPQVGMSVEMDHRHRPVFLGIGAQDRQGDEVIAAKGDGACPAARMVRK